MSRSGLYWEGSTGALEDDATGPAPVFVSALVVPELRPSDLPLVDALHDLQDEEIDRALGPDAYAPAAPRKDGHSPIGRAARLSSTVARHLRAQQGYAPDRALINVALHSPWRFTCSARATGESVAGLTLRIRGSALDEEVVELLDVAIEWVGTRAGVEWHIERTPEFPLAVPGVRLPASDDGRPTDVESLYRTERDAVLIGPRLLGLAIGEGELELALRAPDQTTWRTRRLRVVVGPPYDV